MADIISSTILIRASLRLAVIMRWKLRNCELCLTKGLGKLGDLFRNPRVKNFNFGDYGFVTELTPRSAERNSGKQFHLKCRELRIRQH